MHEGVVGVTSSQLFKVVDSCKVSTSPFLKTIGKERYMAKTSKKHKRSERNLRLQAQFCGIVGWRDMGVRKLASAIHVVTGTSTFHQYILKNRLYDDWENFSETMSGPDKKAIRKEKDRARQSDSETGTLLTSEEWEESLESHNEKEM